LNDARHTTAALSVDETKQLTVQWHTMLMRLLNKYNVCCLVVEHLEPRTALFETIPHKRDDRMARRNSKNRDMYTCLSDVSFGRLMISEHYADQGHISFEYRQLRSHDLLSIFSSEITIDVDKTREIETSLAH
jgi:hypothetical protein